MCMYILLCYTFLYLYAFTNDGREHFWLFPKHVRPHLRQSVFWHAQRRELDSGLAASRACYTLGHRVARCFSVEWIKIHYDLSKRRGHKNKLTRMLFRIWAVSCLSRAAFPAPHLPQMMHRQVIYKKTD